MDGVGETRNEFQLSARRVDFSDRPGSACGATTQLEATCLPAYPSDAAPLLVAGNGYKISARISRGLFSVTADGIVAQTNGRAHQIAWRKGTKTRCADDILVTTDRCPVQVWAMPHVSVLQLRLRFTLTLCEPTNATAYWRDCTFTTSDRTSNVLAPNQ